LQTKENQAFNGAGQSVIKNLSYDHAGRLIRIDQYINGDKWVNTSKMTYNELGQLQTKGLHYISGVPLQSVDYTYNIRGWLTQINNPDNLGTDLFGMRLSYNNSETGLNNTLQYNGNISAMVWNSTLKSKQGYAFTYDSINRLNASDYKTNNGSTWSESTACEEKNITYDKNGNIGTLLRTSSSGGTADNFAYNYSGNQLLSITGIGSNYAYDNNGNMTTDGLNGFVLKYNSLNLPAGIKKGTDSLAYIYSATGEKLVKSLNGAVKQYYVGDMVYNNAKGLDYILYEEGMVKKAATYVYEYNLKDHLGNTRVMLSPTSNNTISTDQVDEYYPFGLSYRPISPDNGNKYLYNGKEIQDETLGGKTLGLYDYGARFYDPQIGRWSAIDPLAEKYASITPYNYCANNPMIFIDTDGKKIIAFFNNVENDFKTVVNNSFSGKVNIRTEDAGLGKKFVYFELAKGVSLNDLNEKERKAFKTFNTMSTISQTISVSMEGHRDDDFMDNFYDKTLFVDDVKSDIKEVNNFQLSNLYHFFKEQWIGQTPGIEDKDYNYATDENCQNCLYLYSHEKAMKSGKEIFGWSWEGKYDNNNGDKSGSITLYNSNGQGSQFTWTRDENGNLKFTNVNNSK
jgi:RHS repeat-associated protein